MLLKRVCWIGIVCYSFSEWGSLQPRHRIFARSLKPGGSVEGYLRSRSRVSRFGDKSKQGGREGMILPGAGLEVGTVDQELGHLWIAGAQAEPLARFL